MLQLKLLCVHGCQAKECAAAADRPTRLEYRRARALLPVPRVAHDNSRCLPVRGVVGQGRTLLFGPLCVERLL